VLGFDDLVIVALNFRVVSAPQSSAGPARPPASATADELSVVAPGHVGPSGTRITARLALRGSGRVQGLSTTLEWDPDVVRPLTASAGAMITAGGGVVLSPAPGVADAALLGARVVGLSGEGVVAEVGFEVLRAGDPHIAIASVIARDAANRPVAVVRGIASGGREPQRIAGARSVEIGDALPDRGRGLCCGRRRSRNRFRSAA